MTSRADGTYVSPRARIAEDAYLGAGVRVYGNTTILAGCVLEDYCVVGKPDMYDLGHFTQDLGRAPADYDALSERETIIGTGCILGTGTHVYCGSRLEEGVSTEDYVRVGWDAVIGSNTRLMFRAQVYCGVSIGRDCRISGFVGDNTKIHSRVSFFGSTTHDYPWRTTTYEYRPSVVIFDDCIVGFGAQLIGGVSVGAESYIGANAVVTRDVPPATVVTGFNHQILKSSWPGRLGQFLLEPPS